MGVVGEPSDRVPEFAAVALPLLPGREAADYSILVPIGVRDGPAPAPHSNTAAPHHESGDCFNRGVAVVGPRRRRARVDDYRLDLAGIFVAVAKSF